MIESPLHYCAHAIQDLRKFQEMGRSILSANKKHANDPEFYNLTYILKLNEFICKLLKESVKFSLPDNGLLINDEQNITESKFSLFKMPYPLLALEYDAPDLDFVVNPGNLASTKRISLAVELGSMSAELRIDATKIFPQFPQLLTGEQGNKVLVFSVYHCEIGWAFSGGAAIIDPGAKIESAYHKFKKRNVNGLRTDVIPVEMIYASEDDISKVAENLGQDTKDEVMTLIDFCAAMNCKNVYTEVIHPSKTKNRIRVQGGKVPFFSYHVLTLNPSEPRPVSVDGNGSHASPRMHLRRGHIRRYGEGKATWVNATIVGNVVNGVADKSYRVTMK